MICPFYQFVSDVFFKKRLLKNSNVFWGLFKVNLKANEKEEKTWKI